MYINPMTTQHTDTRRAQKQTCLNVDPDEWPQFVAIMRSRGVSASKAVQRYVSQVIAEETTRAQ